MSNVIIGTIVVVLMTVVLNIIIDSLILREKEDIFEFIKSFWKEKKYIIMYSVCIILEVTLFILIGANSIFYLYYFMSLLLYRIAIIDYFTKYVENKLLLLLIITAVSSLVIDHGVKLSNAIITGGVTFLILFIMSKVTKGALGMGDAELLGILGFVLGFQGLMSILVLSSVFVFCISIFLIIKSRANKNKELAFTPFIFLALFTVLIINNI
ncbi:prepilin peptidase [Inconstantimicrobium mannanitabidum]|uniref:Uncharacterized protein n=1 Tax=Inconstantimicrobium mannanitabidum TaxID=1604901 RepID=A0ACB5RE17_9CLOT|nr:A24 family peptidase [Clostridium sp. TW13]GKX67422.1 hypothetical protein rsdtw13_26800 [Clostridium sp. TW13]